MDIKIQKLKENAIIPTRATGGSAGIDLHACIDSPVTIEAGQRVTVPTGIAVALPSNQYGLFIFARSGLGIKYGISLSNGVGVVDSDYRGEICVGLQNSSNKSYTVAPNDRIAQMVVMPVCTPNITEVTALDDTARSTGGFGSTGK